MAARARCSGPAGCREGIPELPARVLAGARAQRLQKRLRRATDTPPQLTPGRATKVEESRVALSVVQNETGRWEWVLTFVDDIDLPSRRVSDEDFATREEALAAGESAQERFAGRLA